jgi:hypothetical protein
VSKQGGRPSKRGARKKRTKIAPGPGGAQLRSSRRARPALEDVLGARTEAELEELYRFWGGAAALEPPTDRNARLRQVQSWMQDPALAESRVANMGRRMNRILFAHLKAAGYQKSFEELAGDGKLSYLSTFDLESCLVVLVRHALLVECEDRRVNGFGGRAFAIPRELGDTILRQRRVRRRGVFDVLTLRGYLDRMYDEPARRKRSPPTRVRELYKMYSNETTAVARIERLEGELGGLVEKAILQFGGILPRSLFERMETDIPRWNAQRWRKVLEESLVGTVERLELSRYGIHHNEEALLIFNEVALAYLKRVAVPSDPDAPHSGSSLGVDLASNISRFIGFILEHNVRFTVRGEIFKTTEKRMLQELIPNPGRELSRSAVFDFIYDFTRASGLIESTGERTFALSAAGRNWEQKDLEQKLRHLVDFAIDERGLGGDAYHQLRMRRILLRMLKRVEPGVWYDLMYLPFLARNTYLANLDQLCVDEYFGARAHPAHYAPMEDAQRLAWNLSKWVRKRMYLLGLVDLGYDASDRPVALRLTRFGARMVGASEEEGAQHQVVSGIGSLIVTPDFEVVLFPTGDDAELVHELDRFCVREGASETLHFRIVDKSVQRALAEGLYLSRILATLRTHSRTPVPQNVLFSIRDWAHRTGVMTLGSKGLLNCEDEDTLRRFQQDPGVRGHVREAIDSKHVQLKSRYSMRRMLSLLRDQGYLVEPES